MAVTGTKVRRRREGKVTTSGPHHAASSLAPSLPHLLPHLPRQRPHSTPVLSPTLEAISIFREWKPSKPFSTEADHLPEADSRRTAKRIKCSPSRSSRLARYVAIALEPGGLAWGQEEHPFPATGVGSHTKLHGERIFSLKKKLGQL